MAKVMNRLTSVVLVVTMLLATLGTQVFATETVDASLQSLDVGLSVGKTYIFENTGAEDASVTAMGSVSKNVRADWIILSSDGSLKSHGNYGYICYLQDQVYILAAGEKMIVMPISDHYGNTSIAFSWDSGISIATATKEPIRRYHLSKNSTYSFINNTSTNQAFFFSGDINHGTEASANVYADYLFEDEQQNVKGIGCGNTISLLQNVCITLNPGDRYIVCPRKDQTAKTYVVAYTLNYGLSGDIQFSSGVEKPIRRINLQKGYDYTIVNTTSEDLPIYFSGQWSGADVSANIKANYSVYKNGTRVSENRNKYLSFTSNSQYTIYQDQLWKITPISDYYSSKNYVVAFVPYTVDETELTVTVDTSTRYDAMLSNMSLTVFENEKDSKERTDSYVLSKNANAIYDGTTYPTDDTGVVLLPNPDNASVTIEKKGFVSRTITAERLKLSQKVYLQRESTGAPVISAVWVENIDVRSQNYAMDLLGGKEITLSVEIDWGEGTYGSIALMQDERTVLFNGTDLTMVLSEHFDVSQTIFVVAKDTEGDITKKALKIEVGDAAGTPAWLNGLSFNLGDSLSFTIPEDVNPKWMAGKEIGTGISSLVPVTISVDNGKVYVAVGVDLTIYERSDNFATSTASKNKAHNLKTTTFVSQFKDMEKQIKETGLVGSSGLDSSLKKLKNFESTFRQAIKYPQGKFGFDADFTVLGFAEGYYAPDAKDITDITWIDSGLIVNPRVGVSATYPVIPMVYLEGGISASVLAQFNLYIQEQAKNFTPDGQLAGTLAMNLGIGAGVKGILYGSGGVKGELSPLWRFNYGAEPDYFKLTATGKWYGKFNLLFWDVPLESAPWYEEVWIEHPKTQKSGRMFLMNNETTDIYSSASYGKVDMSYLDEDSDFYDSAMPNSNAFMSRNYRASSLDTAMLKTNIYQQSTPQYVQFNDGTGLAVWQDAKDSNMNSLCLYYSYFDGSDWSKPALVYDDKTVDNAPYLMIINDKAYLTWQNATRAFSDNDTIESIAPYFDIAFAEFNTESGFVTQVVSCNGLDMMPTICGSDETVYVVWSKNSADDWFGTEGSDSIYHCEYTSGTMSDVVCDYENLNSVVGIAANYDKNLKIAYCMDEDGNTATYDDIRLYENGTRLTAVEALETYPAYQNNKLYWNSNGNVVSNDDGMQDMNLGAGKYQIVQGNGETVLVYISSNGLASTLKASYLSAETQQWCEPIDLTDGTSFIGAFSASVAKDGTLTVLINSQEVIGTYEDEEPYGESILALVTRSSECDLVMGELMYAADSYNAGNAMELCFDLTNKGSQTVRSATITMIDEEGNVLSSVKMNNAIVPGQTITASTYFNIDATATGQTIEVTVLPDELSDINTANNSQRVELSFEDLCVEQASWGMRNDGTKVLSANIVNYGYSGRSSIVVELREGSIDGALVGTTAINLLEALSLDTVTFELKNSNSDVYYISVKESGDIFTANDSDYVAVSETDEETIVIDKVSDDGTSLYIENNVEGKCIVGIYDAEGKMLTCGVTDVLENAGEVVVPYSRYVYDGNYTVKVFLVDSSYAPTRKCVIRSY